MSAADAAAGVAARTRAPAVNWISWVALAMMTTSSVASLRAAPTMAVYGLACVFLYLLPAIVFLLPTSLVSAELASGWEGGIYNWVVGGHLQADGLPGRVVPVRDDDLLLPEPARVRGEHARLRLQPRAGQQRRVDRAASSSSSTGPASGSPSRGTKGVAGLASGGLIIGTLIPGVVLVLLGMVFLGQGNASAAPMNADHLLPGLGRPLQPGAHRQQLPVLLRHGDERGPRRPR